MLPLTCSCNHVFITSFQGTAGSWNTKLHFAHSWLSNSELLGWRVAGTSGSIVKQWSFIGGSRITIQQKTQMHPLRRRNFSQFASCILSPEFASNTFTLGTIAVLPFYALMVLAPNSELTKRTMESCVPHVTLGILYTYAAYLAWTPDTIKVLFASQYFLPELTGIAGLFSSKMFVTSAWLHLLVVDLFAAREIFNDGLKNRIETRLSVIFCLFSCPVGIILHMVTKSITNKTKRH